MFTFIRNLFGYNSTPVYTPPPLDFSQIYAAFTAQATFLRMFMRGMKEEITETNTLNPLIELHNAINPHQKISSISALESSSQSSIDSFFGTLIDLLKNQEFVDFIVQGLQPPNAIHNSIKDSYDQNTKFLADLLSHAKNSDDTTTTDSLESFIKTSSDLTQAVVSTPDSARIFSGLTIPSWIKKLQEDKQAMEGLEKLCAAFSRTIGSWFNDDSLINNQIMFCKVLNAFSSTVASFNTPELKDKTDNIVATFVDKMGLNAVNSLEPIIKLQVAYLDQLNKSRLLKKLLKDQEAFLGFYQLFKAISNTAIYQRYKAQIPEIKACLNTLEKKLKAGLEEHSHFSLDAEQANNEKTPELEKEKGKEKESGEKPVEKEAFDPRSLTAYYCMKKPNNKSPATEEAANTKKSSLRCSVM